MGKEEKIQREEESGGAGLISSRTETIHEKVNESVQALTKPERKEESPYKVDKEPCKTLNTLLHHVLLI